MAVKHYRELIVWQKAIDFVENVYRATAGFPGHETYGLTSQLRRAAVSIPSNIAEGQGRQTTRDFLRFLWMAHGSLLEVETQLIIADRLRYLDASALSDLMSSSAEIGRILNGLIRRLNSLDHPDS